MKAAKFSRIALLSIVSVLLGAGAVYAASTQVTASIKFVSDLTLTFVTAPNFGYVQAGTAGTYVLDTTGAVTPSGGGVTEGGTPAAGDYLIKGSATQTITIKTGTYVVAGSSTPSAATCKYGAGSELSCDAGISVAAPTTSGTHVKLGLTVATTTGGTDGTTDQPKFTLTVTYN